VVAKSFPQGRPGHGFKLALKNKRDCEIFFLVNPVRYRGVQKYFEILSRKPKKSKSKRTGENIMQLEAHEKRRSTRYALKRDMQIIMEGRALPVRLVNVSERGAGLLVASTTINPDEQHLMILRCEVGAEIIDVSLEVRHYHFIKGHFYVGAEVVTDLNESLIEYIRNHQNIRSNADTLEPSLSRDFLEQVQVEASSMFKNSENRILNKSEALPRLETCDWVSYIGLSSQILSTRIYLSYDMATARAFCGLGDDVPDAKVHDYMREKTNVIAGKIKRWVLAQPGITDASCGNFRVRMPCTEAFDAETYSSIRNIQHGLIWETQHTNGQNSILGCAFLQIDDSVKAADFLKLLTGINLTDATENHGIEFL
jgi:hypothetical protein